MASKRYDWDKIQSFYDSGKTWREIIEHFGVSMSAIDKAQKRGSFVSRDKSSALKLSCKQKTRRHSEETKQKLSQIRQEYLKNNPDKVPYLLNHYSQGFSYPEKYFESLFRKENINLIHHYQIGIYQLDFADVNKKIDIEIDGEQHYLDLRITASDKRRTAWLEKRDWTVYRIRWSDYQKMNTDNRHKVVEEIKNLLTWDFIGSCAELAKQQPDKL